MLQEPWPWYIAGPLIGMMVPLLLWLGNRKFGISSTLRHLCAACLPSRSPFFQYNWKAESWNLVFSGGILIGGWIAISFLSSDQPMMIHPSLTAELSDYNITPTSSLVPTEIFNWDSLLTMKGAIMMILGGFLVGFGTRYAGGCTSGHAIMGLSNLQWPSLVATCCFMAGGILMANWILPFILQL